LFAIVGTAQNSFYFNKNIKKQFVPFKLLSNLIVFPIDVNGKKLNFILDSGVGNTILFNLSAHDSIRLKNIEKIKLRGLGSEPAVDAILSQGNEFRINGIVSNNQRVYVVDNDSFDLSSKLGLTVNGIIGYELLKDFEVKINYGSKKLIFYKSGEFKYQKCRNCESFNLEFNQYKPYINIGARLDNSIKITPIKLLIDSGGSDAMWLFTDSHPDIKAPIKFFNDFLGEGLSGSIYGKRSKINSLVLGKFVIKNPTVSYPDSVSVAYALNFTERNGSLGGAVLKRFVVIFDYKNSKITLKKGSHFKEPFRYNMSGIELVHNGKVLVQEYDKNNTGFILGGNSNSNSDNKIVLAYNYKYTFKPSYKIFKLREDSPAYIAGLKQGDIVIKINGKYTFNMELEEIVEKFYQKESTKITMVIERNNKNFEYQFYLKDILK
tara:strand:+ start:92 stop:1396 length:1305 start_codon:yes stop_codon:yes gene_type:complete